LGSTIAPLRWLIAILAWLRKNRHWRLNYAVDVVRTMLFPVQAVRTRRMLIRVISGLAMEDSPREVVALLCEVVDNRSTRDGMWVRTLCKLLEATADPEQLPLPYSEDLVDRKKRSYHPHWTPPAS